MKAGIVVALACSGLLAGCAAEQSKVAVKPGVTTPVGFMATLSVGCEDHSPPNPVLAEPPRSGKVTFGVAKIPFNNKESPCNGMDTIGAYTAYTPQKGFRGQDQFLVRYEYDSNDAGGRAARAVEYVVDVK